jgi:hypothetical protein
MTHEVFEGFSEIINFKEKARFSILEIIFPFKRIKGGIKKKEDKYINKRFRTRGLFANKCFNVKEINCLENIFIQKLAQDGTVLAKEYYVEAKQSTVRKKYLKWFPRFIIICHSVQPF